MVFIVRLKPHHHFERHNNDLIYHQQISLEMVRQCHELKQLHVLINTVCVLCNCNMFHVLNKGSDWFLFGGGDSGWKAHQNSL